MKKLEDEPTCPSKNDKLGINGTDITQHLVIIKVLDPEAKPMMQALLRDLKRN